MFFFTENNLACYQKSTSENSRKKVPGLNYIEKIIKFQKLHFKQGELFSEYLRQGCKEHRDGILCNYCSTYNWSGPEISGIPQPVPDQSNLPHFLPIRETPITDEEGKPRNVDDYQPRV